MTADPTTVLCFGDSLTWGLDPRGGESSVRYGCTVWTDPDFDPDQKAFYYARVIEIPTPRWSTYDAVRFGIDIPKGAPALTQERAYTSPIWYAPKQ